MIQVTTKMICFGGKYLCKYCFFKLNLTKMMKLKIIEIIKTIKIYGKKSEKKNH